MYLLTRVKVLSERDAFLQVYTGEARVDVWLKNDALIMQGKRVVDIAKSQIIQISFFVFFYHFHSDYLSDTYYFPHLPPNGLT